MISFEIPIAAIPYSRPGQGILRFTPARQRSFMKSVGLLARSAMGNKPPLEGPLELRIRAEHASPKSDRARIGWKLSRPDLDNCCKAVTDSMNGIVFIDDAQICRLSAEKAWAPEDKIIVKVSRLDGTPTSG